MKHFSRWRTQTKTIDKVISEFDGLYKLEKWCNFKRLSCSKAAPFSDVLQNDCSERFHKIHRKTPVLESFYDKSPGLGLQLLTPARVFFCEFCEMFKGTCFIEYLRTTALFFKKRSCSIFWRVRWRYFFAKFTKFSGKSSLSIFMTSCFLGVRITKLTWRIFQYTFQSTFFLNKLFVNVNIIIFAWNWHTV